MGRKAGSTQRASFRFRQMMAPPRQEKKLVELRQNGVCAPLFISKIFLLGALDLPLHAAFVKAAIESVRSGPQIERVKMKLRAFAETCHVFGVTVCGERS